MSYVIWEVSLVQNRIKATCDSLLLCVRSFSIYSNVRDKIGLDKVVEWISSSYHTWPPIGKSLSSTSYIPSYPPQPRIPTLYLPGAKAARLVSPSVSLGQLPENLHVLDSVLLKKIRSSPCDGMNARMYCG